MCHAAHRRVLFLHYCTVNNLLLHFRIDVGVTTRSERRVGRSSLPQPSHYSFMLQLLAYLCNNRHRRRPAVDKVAGGVGSGKMTKV
jgi:hypothetical protein